MTTEKRKLQSADWVAALKAVVSKKPLVIFRFNEQEWERLRESRRGTAKFTFARSYTALDKVLVPTACILSGHQFAGQHELHFGLLKAKSANTALECRLKVESASPLGISTEPALLRVITNRALKANFRVRLKDTGAVVRLSSALSVDLTSRLANNADNHAAMRSVADALEEPRTYSGNRALQWDAVGLALKAFGLSQGDAAATIEADNGDSILARVPVHEDAVIEHDARTASGFALKGSALTGRAVFRRGDEVLEVITANKRPLEEALGVDLIYLNAVKMNVVMVQYKMLEPQRTSGSTDWLYRPDAQLRKELARMELFARTHTPGPLEYRINPQVFYLRFIRRDAELGKSTMTMPIDHFEVLRGDPACKGRRGAFRISYDTLAGRYLRQDGFLDLVSAGYIGAYAKETADLTAIIDAVLKNDRAVVAAVQTALRKA
jgi:hypothetical protein